MTYLPQKVAPWYDDIIDYLVDNPGCSLKSCAEALGRTPTYIHMLMRSDFMKARLEARRAERRSRVDAEVADKAARVVTAGLDLLHERMTTNTDRLPTKIVAETTRDLLGVLGYTPQRVGEAPTQQLNLVLQIPSNVLEAARAKIRTIEGESAEVSTVPQLEEKKA